MKHGKKLLMRHKYLLKKEGHNPDEFLYIKDTPEFTEFVQKDTNKTLVIGRQAYDR